jgi:hypothetical protein
MAAIQKTAAGPSPRPDHNPIVANNSVEKNKIALIVFNCHASHLLKFLDFDVFCAYCTSTEKIIRNYTCSKTVLICEGSADKLAFLKKFEKNQNVYSFTISESVIEWFERLRYAGAEMARDVMKAAFDSAKPLSEVFKNEK